jgi:immune inhibitor A
MYWWIVAGIALTVMLCCLLVACSVLWLFWPRPEPIPANDEMIATIEPDPTPVAPVAQDQPGEAEHQTALAVAQSTLPERDLYDLALRLKGLSPSQETNSSVTPPGHRLGDTLTFWLQNVGASSFFTATATLEYETPHAYWWIEEGYDIPQKDLIRSARDFERRTYPTNHEWFGSEWNPGIDGDPHIYLFLGNVPGVGGYFSSPDEYPADIVPRSNEHETVYINLDNARPGNDYFDGILAHEFQHMIHWLSDRNEDTWVNEGLSELAGQVNGYDIGGSDWLFTEQPDTQLTTWPELDDSGPSYGASYLFMAYLLERYGQEAIRQLVAEPANGIAGFDAVLAQVDPARRRFQDLFADWVIANYLDDPGLAGGRYGYTDLRIDRPQYAALYTTYPVEQRAAVHQYAADYIVLGGEGTLKIDFSGSTVVPLVGNKPHDGDYQWWSNRGDEGDTTLTRAFDLSGLQRATLQAWMWYSLEADYDYAYVEVSTDGGQTWDLLSSEHTTDTNPNDSSYGPGFTGMSGSGDEPQWLLEHFDLSPYAGQIVLVRFEVVTDDTVNYPGLCIDDIAVPELGYQTGAEDGADGWQAAGWLRVTEQIPQQFLVQLITFGAEKRVERMPLDEAMQGTMTVTGLGDGLDRAVLVVSAMAPATTEQATYAYQITQQ